MPAWRWKEKRSDQINHQPTDNWLSCTPLLHHWEKWHHNLKLTPRDLVPSSIIPGMAAIMNLLGSRNYYPNLTHIMAPLSSESRPQTERLKTFENIPYDHDGTVLGSRARSVFVRWAVSIVREEHLCCSELLYAKLSGFKGEKIESDSVSTFALLSRSCLRA